MHLQVKLVSTITRGMALGCRKQLAKGVSLLLLATDRTGYTVWYRYHCIHTGENQRCAYCTHLFAPCSTRFRVKYTAPFVLSG